MISKFPQPITPLIKWAGGKRTLLPEILPRIFKNEISGRYFEPFLGGGAVFFGLQHPSSVISDLNSSLINFYERVKTNSEELHELIVEESKKYECLDSEQKKSEFMNVRERFNVRQLDTRHAADFYLLNKLSFNGLYRESAKGMYNTPFGYRDKLPVPDKQNWDSATELLRNAQMLNRSFSEIANDVLPGDFVYFDPPYIPLTPTASFTSYSADGFGHQQQEELADLCKVLDAKGVNFLLSNSDTELTRQIFSDFRHTEIRAQRLVSAKAKGRNSVQELLISNFDQEI